VLALHPKKALRGWACPACQWKNQGKKCVRCGTGKATKRSSISTRCDALAAWCVKALAGFKCSRCGTPGQGDSRLEGLEWSHRVKRRFRSVRWDLDNADCLCRTCHSYFESRPIAYAEFWRLKGADPADLERRANLPWDRDYGRVLAILQAKAAEIKERLKNA